MDKEAEEASRRQRYRIKTYTFASLGIAILGVIAFISHIGTLTIVILFTVAAPLIMLSAKRNIANYTIILPEDRKNSTTDTLSILPPKILSRYSREKWKQYGIIFVLIMIVFFLYLRNDPSDRLLAGFAALAGIPIIALVFQLPARQRTEKKLAENFPNGLILSPQGMRCNIALIDGSYRQWLYEHGQGGTDIPWKDISSLIVQAGYNIHGTSYPPIFIFTLQAQVSLKPQMRQPIGRLEESLKSLEILRRPLYGHEQEIIDYIRGQAPFPIEIKDTLH